LYERTGRPQQSTLRKVDLESGEILSFIRLDDALFGEGLALFEERLFQLTWEAAQAFVYDLENFQRERVFDYSGEGWGLTYDGSYFIKSDGSDSLAFLDPGNFREVRRVQVRTPSGPVTRLNELEYIRGELWANVWHTDFIVRINPENGAVTGAINLAGLLPANLKPDDPEGVLNGIAFDPETGRLFVTGKLWPKIYEISLQ
jgi:glutamine cyclotransferase